MSSGTNFRQIEEIKKFTLNLEKSKYIIINTVLEREDKPDIDLLKEKIEQAKEYEYLGNFVDEKGNMERQINEIEKKKSSGLEQKID